MYKNTRTLKITLNNGGGSKTPTGLVRIPITWIRDMDLTLETGLEVDASYDNERKEIRFKKHFKIS